MNKIAIAIATVAVMAVAGCTSSGDGTKGTTTAGSSVAATSATTTVPSAPSAPTPDELHNGKVIQPSSLMYALRANGFQVTDVTENSAWVYGPAGTSLDVRVNGIQAGLNTFKDAHDTRDWTEASQMFGGIAVVGDTWAVSLDSDESGGTTIEQSKTLAIKIATALHAQVKTTA